MSDKAQEQQAIALFIESFRIMHGVALAIRSDHAEDFPDFILSDPTANNEIWVEVVQAIESGELLAAERRLQRLYEVAAQELPRPRGRGRFDRYTTGSRKRNAQSGIWCYWCPSPRAGPKDFPSGVDSQGP